MEYKMDFRFKISVFTVMLLIFFIAGFSYSDAAGDRSVRYLLFKAVDKDSDRSVNGAAVTFNKKYYTSSSPSGLMKIDIQSPQFLNRNFIEMLAVREGYYDQTLEVSIKNPEKIMQPVKIFMKQKMGKLNGRIKGCYYDRDGHQEDKYAGDQIKVFGNAVSTQTVMYKFNSDDEGNFKIFNFPIGTYEIEIRHKTWQICVETPEVEIDREFVIRQCGREEFHRAK